MIPSPIRASAPTAIQTGGSPSRYAAIPRAMIRMIQPTRDRLNQFKASSSSCRTQQAKCHGPVAEASASASWARRSPAIRRFVATPSPLVILSRRSTVKDLKIAGSCHLRVSPPLVYPFSAAPDPPSLRDRTGAAGPYLGTVERKRPPCFRPGAWKLQRFWGLFGRGEKAADAGHRRSAGDALAGRNGPDLAPFALILNRVVELVFVVP
jgi:hypothetical protein